MICEDQLEKMKFGFMKRKSREDLVVSFRNFRAVAKNQNQNKTDFIYLVSLEDNNLLHMEN